MNKLTQTLISLGIISLLTGCERISPGYVGIKVNQYGSQKGIEDFPVQTGTVFYNPITSDIYQFPTFMQNVVWDKDGSKHSPGDDSITFNSIEGAVINVDLALAYSFEAAKVPDIFVKFRQEPEVISHGFLKNEINNSFNRIASTMKATDIFGEKKQELLDNVKKDLNGKLSDLGFKFDLISFHGALRVDQSVQQRINSVLEASQKAIEAETKIRQSEAEAKQKVAQAEGENKSQILKAQAEAESITLKARAQAEANKLLSESITPNLVLFQLTEKWNGVAPQVLGGQSMNLLNLTNK